MQNGGTTGSEASSIAIVGMSGRFPGAPNVATYWENIREGRETIRVFTEQELLAAGERPELLRDPAYVKACGYLDDIDKFDANAASAVDHRVVADLGARFHPLHLAVHSLGEPFVQPGGTQRVVRGGREADRGKAQAIVGGRPTLGERATADLAELRECRGKHSDPAGGA